MNKKITYGDAFIVEDFLPKDLLERVKAEIYDDRAWDMPNQVGIWTNNIKPIFSQDIKSEIDALFKELMSEYIDKDKGYLQHIDRIQRYVPGTMMDEHFDDEPNFKTNKSITLTHGIILYLNSDFVGGEFEYTTPGIKIQPTENLVICHPGTTGYMHKVHPIISGNRYTISTFGFYDPSL